MGGEWFRSPDWSRAAQQSFETRLARARSARTGYLRIKGMALAEAGEIEGARTLWRRVLETVDELGHSDRVSALEHLGDSYASEDPDRAIEFYRASVQGGFGFDDRLHLALADLLISRNQGRDLDEAESLLLRWLRDVNDGSVPPAQSTWRRCVTRLGVVRGDDIVDIGRFPAWLEQELARTEGPETERDRFHRLLDEASVPIFEDLEELGYDGDRDLYLLGDFGQRADVLVVLLRHLQDGDYPDPLRGILARCFDVPAARPMWEQLVRLYRAAPVAGQHWAVSGNSYPTIGYGEQEREGLAASLSKIAQRRHFDELADLATDSSLGPSRVLLLGKLARLDKERGLPILRQLVNDPDTRAEATHLLQGYESRARKRAEGTGRGLRSVRDHR